MKRSTLVILLLLLLPTGGVLTHIGSSLLRHRYDDRGAGTFYGFVKGHLRSESDYYSIIIEGRSEPRWHWSNPGNYAYQTLTIEWDADGAVGKGELDLATLTMTSDGSTFQFTEQALRDMLLPQNSWQEPPSHAEIEELYAFVVSAGQGTLPPPRHHGHSFEGPLYGHLTHFSLGSRIPHAVLAWPVVWLVIVAFVLLKQRPQAAAGCIKRAYE